jgi:hypothetical protein
MFAILAGLALAQGAPTPNRYDWAAPLPNLAPVKIDRFTTGVGIGQQMAKARGLQARILWIDATANLGRMNSEAGIRQIVRQAADLGFNATVWDVKPIIGYTLYPSAFTEQLLQWRKETQMRGFNGIPAYLDESRKLGMGAYLCLNAFSEGHRLARSQSSGGERFADGKPGPGYANPEEQSVVLRTTQDPITGKPQYRLAKSGEVQDQIPLMMNPHLESVQKRILDYVYELAQFHPDGILFDDRLRYSGPDGDFSDAAKEKFERYVGESVTFPTSVFSVAFGPKGEQRIVPGKWWDAWWAFRARSMKAFMQRVRHSLSSEIQLGIYAGSWYGEYDKYGANYGAATATAGFPHMTRAFRKAGFAHELDFFIGGAYYRTSTMFDAIVNGEPMGRSIEAAGQTINRAVDDETWAIAGIALDKFYDQPALVEPALQAAAASSQGVMVFDLSHRFEQFAPHLKRAFAKPAKSPLSSSRNLNEVRELRAKRRAMGQVPPPVFMWEGSPGAGH